MTEMGKRVLIRGFLIGTVAIIIDIILFSIFNLIVEHTYRSYIGMLVGCYIVGYTLVWFQERAIAKGIKDGNHSS